MTNSTTRRPSFIIHKDSLSILDHLNNEQAGKLFKAIITYATTKTYDKTELWLVMAMSPFIVSLDKQEKTSHSGQFHWNWQNGKSKESAIIRQSCQNKNWRILVFKRDDYTCQKCFSKGGKLHAHHKKEFSKYPHLRFDLNNGITLCVICHRHIHSKAFDRLKPNRFF